MRRIRSRPNTVPLFRQLSSFPLSKNPKKTIVKYTIIKITLKNRNPTKLGWNRAESELDGICSFKIKHETRLQKHIYNIGNTHMVIL